MCLVRLEGYLGAGMRGLVVDETKIIVGYIVIYERMYEG